MTEAQAAFRIMLAYKEGWKRGYSEGGEHDCRMFITTADGDWEFSEARKALIKDGQTESKSQPRWHRSHRNKVPDRHPL